MGGHERGNPRPDGEAEGEQFAAKECPHSRPDDRQLLVGIGGRVPVTREMFSDRKNSPGERSLRERDPEGSRGARVFGEGTVPDHRIARVAAHVEDRGEIHVDPHRPKLCGGCRADRFRHGLVPAAEQGAGAGRRKPGKRGFLEARHAPSLLVDGDQRKGVAPAGGGSDLAAKAAYLCGALDVA